MPDPDPPQGAGRPRGRGAADAAVLALVAAPFVVAAVRILRFADHVPYGDEAALDIDSRLARHTVPVLGSYSQYGFRHPGPAFEWWMAAFRAVVGRTPAFALGMVALDLALLLAGLLVVRRRWGHAGLLAAAALGLLLAVAHGWDVLAAPWNPMVAVLGVPVLVVTATAAWRGDRVATVVAATVATVLVQSHLGNAGLAVAVVAVLLAAQLVGRPVPAASTARTWLLAAAVSLPLWIGPIAEQLRHGSTGNVWSILRFSRSGAVARTGLGDAASAGLRAFRPVPTWLGGTDAVTGVGDRGVAVWLVVVVVAVAACLLVRARRREGGSVPVRDRVGALAPPVTAVVVSSVALVAAVVVLGTGRGPVRFYYVLHIEAAAFALVAATGWLVVDTALGSARPVPVAAARAGRVVCWTALAVASVVLGVRAVGGLTPTLGVDHLVGPAVEAVQDRAAAGQRVVVSRAAVGGAEPEFGLSMGFLDALDAAGVDVAVGPDVDASTGSRAGPGLQVAVPSQLRAEGSRRGDLTLLLLDGDPAAAPAGWERIGTISPTSTVWERPPPS